MKKFIKRLLFPGTDKKKILSGPAAGLFINYDVSNRSQHLLGLYEREIYPYLEKGMRSAELLVDVGANDGYYVMAFLKSGKKVIACEPGNIMEELVHNAALNGYLPSADFVTERRLVGSGAVGEFVSVKELVKDHNGKKFFLIDIDGGESDLLDSCGNDFDHRSACWLIETHSKELEDRCVHYLEKHHYAIKIIRNAWWRKLIPEQRPLDHNRWLFAEPL